LKAYARLHGEPPASGALPSPESALEGRSGGGAAQATQDRSAIESTIRSLQAAHPADAGNIRSLIELRLSGRSWDQVKATLGVKAAELTFLRETVLGAGIHV